MVALHDALMAWVEAGKIARLPLTGQVAAVSMVWWTVASCSTSTTQRTATPRWT